MNIGVRKNGEVAIVDFEGSLVVGVGDEVITTIVDELLKEGFRKILLNLGSVDYIDSSGLGELVESYKNSQRYGGHLKLLRPQERVRKTLHLTMLLPLFEVHENEQAAIASFAGA
jgi:anti-sigma B factor antagonist